MLSFSFYSFFAILQVIQAMRKKRVFIAINLPPELKEKLLAFQKEWTHWPLRLVNPDNLHITLAFLGYLSEAEISEVSQACQKTALKYQAFDLSLDRICLGPSQRQPRMIWAQGKASPQLAGLKSDLDQALLNLSFSKRLRLRPERQFRVHITLARLFFKKPQLNKEINFIFPVRFIEMMESRLDYSGAKYFVLESIALGQG